MTDPSAPGAPAGADGTERRIALGTTLIGVAAFVLLATWLVPWDAVPGGVPPPVPAESVFSAEHIERAEDHARWARLWGWGSLAVSLAVTCWLGFGARGRRLARRVPGRWWLQVVLVVAALEVLVRLVTLPLAIAQRRLQLDAGLSTSSWPAWTLDLVLGELVDIVTTSVAVLAVVAAARWWPRAWSAIAGGVLAALVLGASFVYPLLVEPLFNSFTPLEDRALRNDILVLARSQGVEVDDVLVADASRRTTTLNAYVSGYGGTRRVVVYDTLLADLNDKQTLSVVAHELSHTRHDDVLLGTFLGATGALAGVGLLGLLAGAARPRGAPRVGEVEAVPMILALAALAMVLASPVQNGISRQVEARADVDALRATNAPQPFAALQRRLAIRSLADPTPPAWSQWWFGSHPTVLERIAIARGPWESGKAARPGRDVRPSPCSRSRSDLAGDAVEQRVELGAEDGGADGHDDGDQRDQEAVLDGGCAPLVVAAGVQQDLQVLDHRRSPSVSDHVPGE